MCYFLCLRLITYLPYKVIRYLIINCSGLLFSSILFLVFLIAFILFFYLSPFPFLFSILIIFSHSLGIWIMWSFVNTFSISISRLDSASDPPPLKSTARRIPLIQSWRSRGCTTANSYTSGSDSVSPVVLIICSALLSLPGFSYKVKY